MPRKFASVPIIDTLLLPVPITDTLMLHDTVLVHLPIEQRQYSDPRYTAWVSGYRPQLDSIQIYQRTEYITKEITPIQKPKRWGIGLQAGYGVTLHNNQVFPAPYIGVGLNWNFLQFQVQYLSIHLRFFRIFTSQNRERWPRLSIYLRAIHLKRSLSEET